MLESLLDKLEEKRLAAERRREELIRAFESDEVADPITMVVTAISIKSLLVSLAVSAAVSVGTSLLTRALTPRQKFTTGQLQGALQIPQSEQGLPITEGYGANPASNAGAFQPSHAYALEDRVVSGGYFYVVTTAGTSAGTAPTFPTTKGATVTSNTVTFTNYGRTGGGFRLGMLVVWTSGVRKHVTKVKTSSGGKGPKAPEQEEITYDLDLAIMPGRGPLRVRRIRANTDTIYQNYLSPSVVHEAEDGSNTLTNASVITTSYASGGETVEMNTSTGAVQFNNVTGAGTTTQIGVGYVASGTRTCEVYVNGVLATTLTLPGNDPSLRWHVSGSINIPERTGNTVKLVNTSAAGGAILYLDRISVGSPGTPTGIPDAFVPPDEPYDPTQPPSPNEPTSAPKERLSGMLAEDVDGSLTGTMLAGGYAGISIYPGNTSQLPDPTMQGAVDAQYGADSTPAFHNRCLIVLANFYLTKYGGAIPLIQTLAEHETLDTFELICGHLSSRTGVLEATDYNYSGLRRLFPRGFVITPPYAPADVMEELARVYNVYFTESDKIYAYVRNSQSPVATLASADLGWVDGDSDEEEGELPALDFDLATETEVSRRYELTFVDPERDFEQNSQGTSRQITTSEKTEKIELALTLYPEEAREVTQRELYEEHVESTKHAFTLDWSYLWLQPGDSVIIEEDDGTTSRIFIESFRPNVGVCPAEGSAEETAVYSQPVSTSGGGVFEVPPVAIPGQTLVSFYDGPAVRTEDEGRPGFLAWVVKRTGDGDFHGATLYKIVEGEPEQVARFDAEATAGVTVTALGAWSDTDAEDTLRTFTADAGTDALTSTAHELETDETVMVSNTGGALPGGLSASTLYYVISAAANTLQLSLTSGGAAVNITSAGTGTHSVQRVIEVDLHDQETVLETVTADQIANGANACLFGNEVVQVRTWELVTGFDRRWRGKNFTRGLRSTEPLTGSHIAGEVFVLLDSAVKLILVPAGELNVQREYRAVTAGQSLDDAAAVDFAWTGGTLKYPAPSVQATLDPNGDWRFVLFGVMTTDPEGERYWLEIDGGRSFLLRGGASRPVSLTTTSALPGDTIPAPGHGKKQYRVADVPGNTLTNAGAYIAQLIEGERSSISATYLTDLTAADNPVNNEARIQFQSGVFQSLVMTIDARTSVNAGGLVISDNVLGAVFTDTEGEATGTRFTVEFSDGKVKFYRNRHLQSNPFYVHTPPNYEVEFPGFNVSMFPSEASLSAGLGSTWADIEIDDSRAAVVYYVAEQEGDFGSAQSTLTVRANQQRVVGGEVVDGQVVEVEFP